MYQGLPYKKRYDGRATEENEMAMVGLVVTHPLPHPGWSWPLVGNSHLHSSIRHADLDH